MDIQTSPDPFARARELGAEIVAAADEIEHTRRIPEALLERLHASRLFRMLLPRAAGGDETEPALYVAAIEELARHDASVAWNVFVANSSALLDTWQTIGLRGTASDSYSVNELFVSEAFSSTREDPTLRHARGPLYAFTMQGLYAAGVAAVGFGIARAMLSEFIALASRKAPRGLARLADNAVVQADVARAEARLGSARAYLIETLSTIYAHADDVAPIEVADRARVRLACTNAIQAAAEVVDFAYKAAGVDAIFPGSPFERRFRDMHTLSQQIQARGAHFEQVGQVLLGVPPEVFF